MANGPNLEDYLEQGLYGTKELKAEERKRFLGTIRERIVIALKEGQVYENKVYSQIEQEMKKHPKTELLLSGEIPYQYLSKYIKIANKNHIPFKIVENKEYDTDIGLVLAYENYAIEKESIFIEESVSQPENSLKTAKKKGNKAKKGFKGLFKKILK